MPDSWPLRTSWKFDLIIVSALIAICSLSFLIGYGYAHESWQGKAAYAIWYHSEDCAPCKRMEPHVQRLHDDGYDITPVVVGDGEWGDIEAVPTTKFYDSKWKEIRSYRMVGFRTYNQIKAKLRKSNGET